MRHQLRLTMRIMVVCSLTLFSLSWLVLLTGGVLEGVDAGTLRRGDDVVYGHPRNIRVAKRFYEPDITSYSQLLKNQRPTDLDFVDFLLGDGQKRAGEGHHHHQQPWDPQMDYIDFLIGHGMEVPSEWRQPFYQGTVPDDLKAGSVLAIRGPQTVKFRPFYAYDEVLRRRKRSKENSSAIDQWKNKKNVKGRTGIKDRQSGKSAIANSISSEDHSESYGNTREAPLSVDSTAQLDDMSVAMCKPQQPGTDLIESSGGLEKREETGEGFRFAFNGGADRPSYDEFILDEKRPTLNPNDYQKPGAGKHPPEMTYDEFLLGEKRSLQPQGQQQQLQLQSVTGESQLGNDDKSLLQTPSYDEFPLGDKLTDEQTSGSLSLSGNTDPPFDDQSPVPDV